MPIPTEHVQAGDLIRADLFNQIIDALADLNARVAELEDGVPVSAGAVKITSVSPANPRIGDQMTVEGLNFDFSAGAARASLSSVLVPNFKAGSSDTKLIFTIPPVPGVAEGGTPVTLLVSNFNTSDSRIVTLQPKVQPPQGNIDLTFVAASPVKIPANAKAFFRFLAEWNGFPAITLTLDADVSTGWTGIEILEDQSPVQPIPNRQITLQPGGKRPFMVGIPIPANAANQKFALTVEAAGQGKSESRLEEFVVGQTVTPPDPDINIEFRTITNGTLDDATIQVAAGKKATLKFDAQLRVAGGYDFTVTRTPSATNWKSNTDAPAPTATEPSFTVAQGDIESDDFAHQSVTVQVTAPPAAEQAQLQLTAKKHGGTQETKRIYELRVV
jgi:hypothetical protein